MQYKHLPHVDIIGYYQFITFRTFDSTDDFLKRLSLQDKPNNKKQLEIDNYLDFSQKGAYLNDDILIAMNEFLKNKNNDLYDLIAFAIMPNHIHILIKPLDKLSLVIQSIKGSSAKMINDILKQRGKFWANDYYDKTIRDENHFNTVYNYIKNNPLKLGEAEASLPRFYGIYE